MSPGTRLRRGAANAITDVAGVRVGHVSLIEGDGPLVRGRGPIRTGVSVIVPPGDIYGSPLPAGACVINGFGKMVGLPQLLELGQLETPIALTNTLSVWRVADALVDHLLTLHPEIGVTAPTVNPVVGECNDGYLNDIHGRHVRADHVRQALAAADGGPVAEGAVGAGAGMTCYGWKGGIGTASRVWEMAPATGASGGADPGAEGGVEGERWRRVTLGALVLANFGRQRDLTIEGLPVGRLLQADDGAAAPGPLPPPHGYGAAATPAHEGAATAPPPEPPAGSVVIVMATDAPLDARQLSRVARRAAAGLARTGSVYHHGSGDFVLAFSTCREPRPYLVEEGARLNPFFDAAADVVEESVYRALAAALPMTGRDGHHVQSLPVARVHELARAHGRTLALLPGPTSPQAAPVRE